MRHGATTQFQSFLRQVDASMTTLHGVGYSEMQPYVEAVPGSTKAVESFRSGASPEAFSSECGRALGLVPAGAGARETNLRIAALAEFASENPDWLIGEDGAAYRSVDGGISRLSPGLDASGKHWGFQATHSAEGALEAGSPGRARAVGTSFGHVAGGRDIGDAVMRLDIRLAPDASPVL